MCCPTGCGSPIPTSIVGNGLRGLAKNQSLVCPQMPNSDALLEAIGSTPLVELHRYATDAPRARIFAKVERCNPGRSLEDRRVLAALDAWALSKGEPVVARVDAHVAPSAAWILARRRHPATFHVRTPLTVEQYAWVRVYGAELVSDLPTGTARDFEGPEIAAAGAALAEEILAEWPLAEPADVLVTPPASPLTTELHATLSRRWPALQWTQTASSLGQGLQAAAELAATEGLLVGPVSGNVGVLAASAARELGPDEIVLAIFPDGRESYYSAEGVS